MREATKAAVSDPLIGRVFGGKYTIERLIGRGGVGLVYLAQQEAQPRQVVLKLLAPDWIQDPEAVARFEREAKRLGGLRHPNIVRMHDYGHQDDRAYLVMEYLQGALLSEYVATERRLALEQFVPIAAQVLKGIGHAHSRELMVRDVKPANIMLCARKGRANFVKILDFGLAKLLKDEQPVTEEHVLGTVGYLAPEVIKGDGVDLRVDVYALGVLFYYMLAGRVPFNEEDNAAVFYKTVNEAPPPLADVLPAGHDVPDGLLALIHRCLEKDPNARPRDANAIVEDLIDVVPASMFRLPRLEQPPLVPAEPTAGFGNTGLVELVGQGALSGRHSSVDFPAGPSSSSADLPIPTALEPASSAPMPLEGADKPGLGMVAGTLIAGALMAVLGGGIAAYMVMGDDEPTSASSDSAPAVPDTADVAEAEEQLAAAEALISATKFEEAAAALDRARGIAAETPTLQGRLERVDRELMVAKLLSTGARFEADGDIAAAVGAYRDVLESEPTNTEARGRLSRLTARPDGEDEESDVAYGPVEIRSRPPANLAIDGEPQGTTPFRGKLPVGKHTLRMTARGYHPWESELDVTGADNAPIRARLVGKGRGSRAGSRGHQQPDPPPATEPQPTPEPEAVPEPKAPEVKPKKKNVFLPTSKDSGENGGGVFLPTKE